jgi:tetratricopeptide (TPR) repeat protein
MKKFKILLLATVAMIAGGSISASAQGKYGADSANCVLYLSYYKEYFKQKNYDSALPNWRKAYRYCPPTASQNMLIDGTTLMRRVISKTSDQTYRKALIDTLLTLQDVRSKYYPKYAVTALNNKGVDMSNFLKDDPQALYDGLNEIIDANGVKTRPSILLFDLNAAISLYKDGKLGAEDVIKNYQNAIALIDQSMVGKTDAQKENEKKVKSDIEGLFINSNVASCDNLIALFTPRYEANPNDLELVTNIVRMMSSTENCTDNDLYLKAATSMYQLEPSPQSAYFLYKLNAARGNVDDAIKYMNEATVSDSIDNGTLASYEYELATFCVKNNRDLAGFEAAQKAMELDPSLTGKCYYLMGTIWGSLKCGGNEITSRANFWVAVDYMQKAKNADSSLTDDCNDMIRQYSVYFPKTADAFMYDLTAGSSYSISCGGLHANTTVRTQN